MTRHFFHRSLVAVLRLIVATGLLLSLMEFSFHLLGRAEHHVWDLDAYGPVPSQFSFRPMGWRTLLLERAWMTGRTLFFALLGIWWIGYAWGILGARLRRYSGAPLLAAPFALLACAPGFWVVILVAVYSYLSWQRPGFADDLVVEAGPDLLSWWYALVVAFPAMMAGVAWQIRAVASVLEGESSKPWLRGWHLAGYDDEEIFYSKILPQKKGALIALSDGTVAAVLGALIVLESAFHYPGLGALLVDSLRAGNYPGTLLAALSITGISLAFTYVRELATPPLNSL